MKTFSFIPTPGYVEFPASSNKDTYVSLPRPSALPMYELEDDSIKYLRIGYDAKSKLMAYMAKENPRQLHWLYPVSTNMYDTIMGYAGAASPESFDKVIERTASKLAHIIEPCALCEQDSKYLWGKSDNFA